MDVKTKLLLNLMHDNNYFKDLNSYLREMVEEDKLSYNNLKYLYNKLYRNKSLFIKQNIFPVSQFLIKGYSTEEAEKLANLLPDANGLTIFCYDEKEKGTLFAIKRLEKFLRHEYLKEHNNDIYFLKCDIKKYFPSIDHQILLDLLRKIDFSEDEMWMIEKLVKEQPNNAETGLPLGNQSSQWFALFYLNVIDRYVKEKLRVKWYVRYMDDMILVHRDKEYLRYCLNEIERICKEKLNLSLNHKTQIGKVKNGIDFLGYRHILNENGSITRKLRSSAKKRLKKHLKTLKKLRDKNIVDDEYVYIRKNAFYNHIKDTKESKKLKTETLPKK